MAFQVAKLCQFLEKRMDEPIQLAGTFNVSIVNALWAIITGEKLQLDDLALKMASLITISPM